ncbi:MAG: sodium:proton antiporter [Caldilineaceae bacterium]|nr:sodium:proton antiporter [Caldilineaceae bacterium]
MDNPLVHATTVAMPLWTTTFFVAMLLSVAALPLVAGHWWHRNANKLLVSLALSLPVLLYLLTHNGLHQIEHAAEEYFAFIVLLGALFVISGGILVEGDIRATPLVNTTFLGLGALLASFMGTTGASMLLIRPLLRTNSERKFTLHTPIFFIFIVSNAGGLLTPLGDPPLFLGYLRGVPFAWTFSLWQEWLFVIGVLLAIYLILDSRAYTQESLRTLAKDMRQVEPLRIRGLLNLLWLGGVILAVAFLNEKYIGEAAHYFVREGVMLTMAASSWFLTPRILRERQNFNFAPITEVAVIFIGIFITMIPALTLLEQRGAHLGLVHPWQFFWSTGILSSFLDNAPTYLTFFSLAQASSNDLHALYPAVRMIEHIPQNELAAISLGAVFMGALTYIGNGPNFMVKAIAESNGVKMPSFFGYMRWSLIILLPIFVAVTLIFFST